jgi:hypothetical protein
MVVDEYEKKVIAELKKLEPTLEKGLVEVVDGRVFSCWGWTVRISRNPKTPTPPKSEEPATSENSSVAPSAPASV